MTTSIFRFALRRISAVMEEGARTHPSGEWWRCPPEYHVARATRHLRLYHEADTSEDHIAHAATRLLMALQIRERELQIRERGRAET
jgi:hypothetical protein